MSAGSDDPKNIQGYLSSTDSMMAKLCLESTTSDSQGSTSDIASAAPHNHKKTKNKDSESKFPEFWRRTALNPIREHKLKSLDSWSASRKGSNSILRQSKLSHLNFKTPTPSLSHKSDTKQIKLSDLAKQVTLLNPKPGTSTSVLEDLNFNRLSLNSNDNDAEVPGNSSPPPSPSVSIKLSSFSNLGKNRHLKKSSHLQRMSRLGLKRGSLSSSSSSLPSIVEEDETEDVTGTNSGPSASNQSSTCSQQALMETNPTSDDVTIDELASYLDVLVHIPKKMSAMAEMMYT